MSFLRYLGPWVAGMRVHGSLGPPPSFSLSFTPFPLLKGVAMGGRVTRYDEPILRWMYSPLPRPPS